MSYSIDIEEEEQNRFSVIIVTFNEKLLENTYEFLEEINSRVNNVLENSNPKYLKEVLIIDDMSDVPVCGWENDTRVRIIRPGCPLRRAYNLRT